MGNAAFVDLGSEVLVLDTFNLPEAARDMRSAIDSLLGKPVRYVVNSHWHGDHIRGNQAFTGAAIIATDRTAGEMAERHPERIRLQQQQLPLLAADIQQLRKERNEKKDEQTVKELDSRLQFLMDIEQGLQQIKLKLPTVTFQGRMTLRGDKRTAVLLEFSGHTDSDIVIYLPEDRMLLAADLVSIDNHPALGQGTAANWLDALAECCKLGVDKVAPGHGPVGDASALAAMEAYLLDMERLAANLTAEDAAAGNWPAVPDDYREWEADFLFTENLRFLIQQGEREKPI